jgi:putative phosphoribosyl transferase
MNRQEQVRIPCAPFFLAGQLTIPDHALGLVLFARSRDGVCRVIARGLQDWRLATLALDLVTPAEEGSGEPAPRSRFDLDLFAGRLVLATDWAGSAPQTSGLPIAYFGASGGAAADILAATERRAMVVALACWNGRPDLGGPALAVLRTPVLLAVGSEHHALLERNRDAFHAIPEGSDKRLAVVPEKRRRVDPRTAEEVARLCGAWFRRFMTGATPSPDGLP